MSPRAWLSSLIAMLVTWTFIFTAYTFADGYYVERQLYVTEPHVLNLSPAAAQLPDAHYLAHQADSAGLPRALVFAVAWTETRANVDPHVRGRHCATLTNCEIGRFQIKPTTAAYYCDDLNVWTYKGNVNCFLRMFSRDFSHSGGVYALGRQIGLGLGSAWQTQYVDRTLALAARMEWAE